MTYAFPNPNGSATSANSSPVVIASDQASIPVAATLNAETTKVIGVTRTADGSGNLVTSTGNALDVNIKTGNPTSITANAGTNLNTSALALETGGNLATIATRTPALGQALAAASVPVILPSATITTLTPPAAITGFALDATLTGGTQQTKLTDGTHLGTIKAASTAAAAADTALVVAVSPNNTVPVSLASVPSHPVTNAGTFAVQVTSLPATPAGTNLIGKFGIDQTTVGTTNGVSVAQIGSTTVATGNGTSGAGNLRVNIASDNTAFAVNATTIPATSGGLTPFHLASAASTNATNIKASAGQLYGYMISNTSAAYSYVAFHNSASAPTAGASIFFKIGIPAGGAANVEFSNGVAFSSGIGITTVTGAADSNATAVAANDLVINIFYK